MKVPSPLLWKKCMGSSGPEEEIDDVEQAVAVEVFDDCAAGACRRLDACERGHLREVADVVL